MDELRPLALELEARVAFTRELLSGKQLEQEKAAEDLRLLLARLEEADNNFDTEDKERVEALVQKRQARLHDLRALQAKHESFLSEREAVCAELRITIQQREKILNGEDDVLRNNEDLLRFFARKQVELLELLRRELEVQLSACDEISRQIENVFEAWSTNEA